MPRRSSSAVNSPIFISSGVFASSFPNAALMSSLIASTMLGLFKASSMAASMSSGPSSSAAGSLPSPRVLPCSASGARTAGLRCWKASHDTTRQSASAASFILQ